jgi:hypothetical protein
MSRAVSDLLTPAELARDDMRAAGLGVPTMAELVVALRGLPDGPQRARLEGWYWALADEKHGPLRARWYREELAWLRTHR